VNVIDVRCGDKLDKVELCKTPPGNPNKTHVVCLSKDAVATQLKNGSMLSVCSSISPAESTGDNTVTIFPNPNKGSFNVMLTDLNSTWCEVRVFDYNGITIDSKSVSITESTESIPFELSTSLKGLYYIRVSSSDGIKMYKLLIE
jgi:hypothetical protein